VATGTRRKRILQALAVALALGCVLLAWAFVFEPDRVSVSEAVINLPGQPEIFDRLKLVVVSDIHAGAPHIKADKLRLLVEKINDVRPDLVLMLGDFVIQDVLGGEFVEPEIIAEQLKGVRAPLGVYAVLGNHDWWFDGERVGRALGQEGIRVLENDAARIEKDGQAFWLAGIADLWTRQPDIAATLAKVTDDAPVIALTHNPDIFPRIPPRVILTLAGHTHGGQVNLPIFGRLVVPSQFGQLYAQGHIKEDSRHLFVTSGVGTSILPVRFRVPPEIVVLTFDTRANTLAARVE
jgi:predicted MPP superfamily phosphohydrolase